MGAVIHVDVDGWPWVKAAKAAAADAGGLGMSGG